MPGFGPTPNTDVADFDRVHSLQDLREWVAVMDRRLERLRENGEPHTIAALEDLRNRTVDLARRLEAEMLCDS